MPSEKTSKKWVWGIIKWKEHPSSNSTTSFPSCPSLEGQMRTSLEKVIGCSLWKFILIYTIFTYAYPLLGVSFCHWLHWKEKNYGRILFTDAILIVEWNAPASPYRRNLNSKRAIIIIFLCGKTGPKSVKLYAWSIIYVYKAISSAIHSLVLCASQYNLGRKNGYTSICNCLMIFQ